MTPTELPESPRAQPAPLARVRHTLLVENNPATADLLRNVIRRVLPQTTLYVATSLAQARPLVAGARPDVTVVDLNASDLPLSHFIRDAADRHGPALVVVAGHSGDDRIFPAILAGACGVLFKHDPLNVIEYALRDALAGMLPLWPSLAREILRHLDWSGRGASLTGPELELLTWLAAGDALPQAVQRMRSDANSASGFVRRIYQQVRLPAGDAPASPQAAPTGALGHGA